MIADLKPYPEYKESGLPWLGDIPEHWASERAKWLFTKMNHPVREDDEVVTCFRDGVVTLRKNRRLRGFTEALLGEPLGVHHVACDFDGFLGDALAIIGRERAERRRRFEKTLDLRSDE